MVEMAPAENGLYSMGFAGDTFNTCWYLRRQRPDWAVDYVTAVGRDAVSDRMVSMLADAGLGTEHVQRRDDRTVGLYMIELQDGERSFSYWRGQAAARLLAEDAAPLARAFEGAGIVYFSGITLGVLEGQGRKVLLEQVAQARAAGCKVAFDSNLRPRLWDSETQMCDAVMEAASVADIVLPSYDDEAAYFGDDGPQGTMQRYLDAGVSCVVVKNGGGPVEYIDNGTRGQFTPQAAARVVDSTAAGDSFNAGFFAALDHGVAAGVEAGSALAGKVIQGRGALVDV
ncbi:2-dehydro-3-deoxygluconate kinase [Litoreibacter arenae DSM 19593]|uniref:2-dehydro-3-deoxygluconate kinase n=2 Tax=Litoreibacter TaxID=947567 RepID=S9Q6G3_9RHOB|nr:2-dehydro-3-deoxygluconate kinase [Litoreibacter arenae DSM 19593]